MIKINDKTDEEKGTTFSNLKIAETFIKDGQHYIKLDPDMALNLNKRKLEILPVNVSVIPTDMEVVAINKKTGEQTTSEGSETK